MLLLVASPGDALKCLNAGLDFKSLNLGNIVCEQGTTRLTCSISLDNSDVDILREIHDAGVMVEARPVPRDHPAKLENIFQSCRRN